MCLTIKQQAGAIRSRLLLALLISVLLHGYFLYQSLNPKKIQSPEPEVLTVALAPKVVPPKPAPKRVQPKPKPIKQKLAKPKPRVAKPKVTPPTVTVPEVMVPATKVAETPAESVTAIPEPVEPAWAQKETEPVDTSLPEIQETEVVPYTQVKSLYNVYADTTQQQQTRAVLGKATMVYQREQNSYQLRSEVRPSGIMRLFLDDLIQQSRGSVTPHGLQPDYFLYQYDKKKYEVHFDWASQTLKLHSRKGDKTAAMVAGTQDLLSFMFQFMFTSPLSQTGMMVTNGKAVHEYRYQFMGEKLVQTELGVFNTVHIVRDDAVKNEQLSLWLAVDYQYLPVKIKKTKPNKNKNYELVIRELQTDQGKIIGDQSSKANAQAHAVDVENAQVQDEPVPETQTNTQPFNPLIQR